MELFPVNCEDPLDSISFLGHMGLLPEVILSNMIDKQSSSVKNAICQLFNNNHSQTIQFYVKSIEILQTQSYLQINQKKIFVHQKWLFKVLLLNSLRHFRKINTEFAVLVKIMVSEIQLTDQATIHILRVLEIILKKNITIIDENLANCILKTMNLVANAPIMGFKYHANNISRSIIKITTLDNIKNIQLLPIRGIDTNDLINNLQLEITPKITPKILELFENNIDNRDGGFLYNKLLENCDFETWGTEIWPFFEPRIKKLEREGEFYQSLTKYWLPTTIKHYNQQCLDFLNIEQQLKAQALYEIRKQGFYSSEHDELLLGFQQNQETSFLVVKIASTFIRKSWPPSPADLACVEFFLRGAVQELEEGVLRSLRQFFSHLLFFGHRTLSKSSTSDLRGIPRFFGGLQRFLKEIFEVNQEVYAQILKVYLDLAKGSSKDLQLLYKLEERDHYGKGGNLFAQNFGGFKIGFFGGSNMSKLIVGHFLDVVSEGEVLSCLQDLSKDLSLQSLEFGGNCAQILALKGCGSVFEVSKTIFCCKNEVSLEQGLFWQTLQLQCLLVDLQSGKPIEGFQNHLEMALEQFLGNFEVYKRGGDKILKISEAFINNILTCLMLSLPENLDDLLEKLCLIIRASNMRKPVTLAVKLMTIVAEKRQNVKFLANILGNILESPNELNITIRRSPETRLVIHSFCSQKFLVSWCMDFLLSLLETNEEIADSSVSSALHSIELLISDNNLHQETLIYIPEIIKNSIILFQKKHWRVRNGVLQVVKALIERFLGVSLSQSTRPKTVEDLFLLFDLPEFFYSFLNVKELNDSMIIVSLFFCESQFKKRPFEDKTLDYWKFKFKAVFFKILQNYFGYYSHLAILSIVAMTTTEEIPNLFQDLVQYLTKNTLKANTLWNFLKILQLLHLKWKNTDLNLEILQETLNKYPKSLFKTVPENPKFSKDDLVQKLLYGEDTNYVKSCYFQDFLELPNELQFDPNFRKSYETLEKYKILTLVVILSHQTQKLEEDRAFIQKILNYYQNLKFDNEEIALTLPYLLKSIEEENLPILHKIAFFLILKKETCQKIANFWSQIMQKPFSAVFRTIKNFLGAENLIKTLKSREIAQNFLGAIYGYCHELQNRNEDTTTFYTLEEDFSVPLTAVIFVCRKEIQFFHNT